MSRRKRLAAAALGALLALLIGAGEAAAQATCQGPGVGVPGRGHECEVGLTGTGDIEMSHSNLDHTTTITSDHVIQAVYLGPTGRIDIDVSDSSLTSTGATARGVYAYHRGEGTGTPLVAIDVDLSNTDIRATGEGVYVLLNPASGRDGVSGEARVRVRGGSIRSARRAVSVSSPAREKIDIDVIGAELETTGQIQFGIYAYQNGGGDIEIDVEGGSVKTAERLSYGIHANMRGVAKPKDDPADPTEYESGDVRVTLRDAAIETAGSSARGIYARQQSTGRGDVRIDARGGSIRTTGASAHGIYALHSGATGDIVVELTGGSISTLGSLAFGVLAFQSAGRGDVRIDARGGSIRTTGSQAYGVYGLNDGAGGVSINLNDPAITTTGNSVLGVLGNIRNAESEADVSIRAEGGSVTAEGVRTRSFYGLSAGLGSVSMTTGTTVKVPFSVGAEGRLTNDENAAGRILITNAGAIEARNLGVRAWAVRSSGSTFEGTLTADDAARTDPMVHVVSSGSVTVGESVPDDFIRAWVAGSDGTLSTAESAVFAAITAEDSDALDAALGAFPAAYEHGWDDAWKARARNLLAKRGYERTAATDLASQAAEEILGLSRAGVRALAISYAAIADHVRGGDQDPAILAIAAADRTAEQAATLAEQSLLSAAERTVLEAVLTGEDLESALAALPAAYTGDWKDGVRLHAQSYNAGNIRVDVTGGAITAEGNGVETLYAVPHERNGAIMVNVAEGASVTGGAAGVYVTNAGAGLRIEKRYAPRAVQEANAALGPDDMVAVEGYLSQVVRVEGIVTGGSDAAVHLSGGGALIVTGAGRLIAGSSGRAVLVNDPGPAIIYIEGEVKGGPGAPAAVHLTGGGTVTVALAGSVDANGAALAIRGDAPTMVVLHVSGGRLTREAAQEAAARVKGGIGGEGVGEVSLVLALTRDGFTTGQVQDVPLDAEGAPVLDDLPPDRFDCGLAEDRRCELYEALPSLLLTMNRLPSLAERMAAPRGARGGWGRIETSRGEWTADGATSAKNLSYDYGVIGARAGVSFDSGAGRPRLGLSVHVLTGEAKMDGVGEIDLTGMGAGGSATWALKDDFYLDAQAQFTRFDADFGSAVSGGLEKGASGLGLSLGVEAGKRMSYREDIFITPRASLAWSSAELGDFTDSVGDPPARVSVEDARSVKGRLGVTIERPMADGGRLFGTLDLEQEFSGETSVKVSDEKLDAEGPSTTLALGVGGAFEIREGVTLRLSGRYETSGVGAKGYGGSATLRVNF